MGSVIGRAITGLVFVLVLAVGLGFFYRLPLAFFVVSLEARPPLADGGVLAEQERWFDDYYTVEAITVDTFAIGEPRYHQQNYSYLLIGQARAVLFDSGTPLRDIRPVVASLTDLPVTLIASHLHYDHVGNHHRFSSIAMLDTPRTRAEIEDGWFRPQKSQHLGHLEKFDRPRWRVSEFWAPGSNTDLGNRVITVIHTPGHTDQSVSLLDRGQNLLLTGDYIYEGPLFAFLPDSSPADYLDTARDLLMEIDDETRLLAAHRITPPGAPILTTQDLRDLERALVRMKDGDSVPEGIYPAVWPVNEQLTIWTDVSWLLRWED